MRFSSCDSLTWNLSWAKDFHHLGHVDVLPEFFTKDDRLVFSSSCRSPTHSCFRYRPGIETRFRKVRIRGYKALE